MKILLDMGHTLSGADLGTEGCGRKEQECTREIGYKIKEKLEAIGHRVIVCSPDNAATLHESLEYRAKTANKEVGDLYISLHLHAFNGIAYGTEIYTYAARKFKEALDILENISSLGYRNRGIKDGSRLYVIRKTVMKAMVIECCFIDNEKDMELYNAEAMASEIVNGIIGKKSRKSWVEELQKECSKERGNIEIIQGIADENTLEVCPMLRIGNTGGIVRIMQQRLTSLGYGLPYGADGILGYGTKQVIMKFQRDNGLTEDGIVGKETWRKLLLL